MTARLPAGTSDAATPPRYDAKIARTMMGWTYRPYLVDAKAVPVCTAITFIYTQR